MNTLFERQGGQYEMQDDYRLPCVALPQNTNEHIGVRGERHRRYLKENHRVRYYNLLTAGKLNGYLAVINQRAEKMFDELVKSLAEKENALISAGKYTDGVDDVLLKILQSKKKKVKVIYT